MTQHLPAITSSKPSAKPSRTGFDQLSNNYKPEPAKTAGSASRFAASRTAATLLHTMLFYHTKYVMFKQEMKKLDGDEEENLGLDEEVQDDEGQGDEDN